MNQPRNLEEQSHQQIQVCDSSRETLHQARKCIHHWLSVKLKNILAQKEKKRSLRIFNAYKATYLKGISISSLPLLLNKVEQNFEFGILGLVHCQLNRLLINNWIQTNIFFLIFLYFTTLPTVSVSSSQILDQELDFMTDARLWASEGSKNMKQDRG